MPSFSLRTIFSWRSSHFQTDFRSPGFRSLIRLILVSFSSQALTVAWLRASIAHSSDQFLSAQLAFRLRSQLFRHDMNSFYHTKNSLKTWILKSFFIVVVRRFLHIFRWVVFTVVFCLDESSKSRSSHRFIWRSFSSRWFNSYTASKIAVELSS